MNSASSLIINFRNVSFQKQHRIYHLFSIVLPLVPILKHRYYCLLSMLVITLTYNNGYSQSCTGSLGDPIVNQTFGTGSNPGASLGTQTNYTYVSTDCPGDGYYAIRNSTTACFGSSWHTLTEDHTTGDVNGYMMVVNASNAAGQFFSQTVTGLCGSSTYEFSSYIINLLLTTACTTNPDRFPNITFSIETTEGSVLKTFNTGQILGTTTPTWNRYATFFTTPPGVSTVVLKLVNNAPGGCGNDLALDDIQFRPCGPTISAAISGASSVCSGSTINLSATVSTGYNTPVYQWQESTDGTNFTDISGANSLTYSTSASGSGNKYYRMLAAETSNLNNASCRVASNMLTIAVTAMPTAPTALTASSSAICSGASSTLSGNCSVGTLTWFSDAALTTNSSNVVSPTSTKTYYAACINGICTGTSANITTLPDDF